MPRISFHCSCGETIWAPEALAGKRAKCPKCGQIVLVPSSRASSVQQRYLEKDNKGTRHETMAFARSYWVARNVSQKFDPFVLYDFGAEKDAKDALLELDCMHLAEDTGKIICTETLIFGYYHRSDIGKYEAIVCGSDLSHELWEKARTSFTRHGGVKNKEQEPTREKRLSATRQGDAKRIEFVREDRQQKMGHTLVYRIYKGPDAASAKAFLEGNPVTKPLHYIVVETPEGNYCRDTDGIYKE